MDGGERMIEKIKSIKNDLIDKINDIIDNQNDLEKRIERLEKPAPKYEDNGEA